MQITVEYAAQVKRATGTGRETVDVETAATLRQLVCHVIARHGETLKPVLLDADGNLHPSILVFVNNEQCCNIAEHELSDGDTVAFLSPISGG